MDKKTFITPEIFSEEWDQRIASPRGRLLIASCRSGAYLAGKVVDRYQTLLAEKGSESQLLYLENIDFQFSDSETCVRLDSHVGGYDVFLFQAPYDPASGREIDQNVMAFLIAARTFREAGASHVTAILPYLAYARQDKPTKFMREPTTAKLIADLSITAGIDRLVAWHPHSGQISGFYGHIRVDMLDPLTLFVEAFEHFRDREDVIAVAPDVGASKFITYFSRVLNLKSAIASKYRPQPEQTLVSEVIGDFAGKRIALVLDDMISSGGTVYALIKKLIEEKGIEAVYLGASHNLCLQQARERLWDLYENYHLQQVVVTNSIPQTMAFQEMPFVTVKSLSGILARVINRIHYDRSVSELFYPQKNGSNVETKPTDG